MKKRNSLWGTFQKKVSAITSLPAFEMRGLTQYHILLPISIGIDGDSLFVENRAYSHCIIRRSIK